MVIEQAPDAPQELLVVNVGDQDQLALPRSRVRVLRDQQALGAVVARLLQRGLLSTRQPDGLHDVPRAVLEREVSRQRLVQDRHGDRRPSHDRNVLGLELANEAAKVRLRRSPLATLDLGIRDQAQEQRDHVVIQVLDHHRARRRQLKLACLLSAEHRERLRARLHVLEPLGQSGLCEPQASVVVSLRAEPLLHVLVPLRHADAHPESG